MGFCSLPQDGRNHARTQNTRTHHHACFLDMFNCLTPSSIHNHSWSSCLIVVSVLLCQHIIIDGVSAFFVAQWRHFSWCFEELQEKDDRSLVGVTSRGGGSGKTVTLEEFGNDLTKAGIFHWGWPGTKEPPRYSFKLWFINNCYIIKFNQSPDSVIFQWILMDLVFQLIFYHSLLIGRRGRKDGSSRRPGCGAGANHPNFGTSTKEQSSIFAWDW